MKLVLKHKTYHEVQVVVLDDVKNAKVVENAFFHHHVLYSCHLIACFFNEYVVKRMCNMYNLQLHSYQLRQTELGNI